MFVVELTLVVVSLKVELAVCTDVVLFTELELTRVCVEFEIVVSVVEEATASVVAGVVTVPVSLVVTDALSSGLTPRSEGNPLKVCVWLTLL